MNEQELASTFPTQIEFPSELTALCDWALANGYPLSGNFELRAHDDETLRCWFGADSAIGHLAQFGAGSDGSLYCVWRSPDGTFPIVHLGSEGDNIGALATSSVEFLRLLAIGYDEVGSDDLTHPPDADDDEEESLNPDFPKWVADTFDVTIPTLGSEIAQPAQLAHGDFPAWVDAQCG